jgi:catechol 2,3-dioxygenase-like lactoylglutathione lyase family enzyme
MRYVHTNIISHDWRNLANFYIEVFACKLVPPVRDQQGQWLSDGTGVKDAHLTGGHLRLPGYDKNGPTLEIYQYHKTIDSKLAEPNQRGYGHLAFEVENVLEVLSKLESAGGKRNGEPASRLIEGVGTITFVYARDPDGNLIELQHWD